ncbi:hypothetical protein H4R33_006165 [Dimargaris cristalligena]|uniref:Major facilitator superfamily-domain-containing protein n=1 Tax=Dimargaris cristalligena TaxID=215637 RepID=A0A4P9ZPM0_9FUNG|nr:hypothetical protein H4R33_006165 [Dimargaris cristalligena]RKP35303.1 major facilitator superfamily-domain-containing protein [Dimargaris cristalligena]|eukprot:RKP35303.1 major facilitator superfamily-domain-containing protein [Dimargaris cristalligena]
MSNNHDSYATVVSSFPSPESVGESADPGTLVVRSTAEAPALGNYVEVPQRTQSQDTIRRASSNDTAIGDPEKAVDLESAATTTAADGGGTSPLEGEKARIKGTQLLVIMVGLCLSLFLAYIDITIVATALPDIGIGLNDFSQVSWIALAYLLTFAPLQPLYGKLSDIFGRVPVIVVSLIVFMIGCAICGAAPTMSVLIAGRAIAGIGGAGLISLPMIVVADIIPLHRRALFLGVFGGVFALASVLGPILGGVFTDYVTWRWTFYFNLPVGGVTLILILLFLRIPHEGGHFRRKLARVDFLGASSLLAAIVFLLLAIVWGGNNYPWNSPVIISFFCLAVFFMVSFVFVELRMAVEPIIPLHLFKHRNFALANACILLVGMIILGSVFYLPVFYHIVRGDSATTAGLKLLPLLLAMVFAALISGIVTAKTGVYRPIISIGFAVATIGLGLLTLIKADMKQATEIGFLVIMGVGCGMCIQTLMLVAQSGVPEEDVAMATSCFSFCQTIGSGIGIAAMSAILNNNLALLLSEIPGINVHEVTTNPSLLTTTNIPADTLADVQAAYVAAIRQIFIVLAPVAGVACIVSLFIKHIPLRKDLIAAPAA